MADAEYFEIISKCEHEPILDDVKGEYICSKCGLVLDKLYVSSVYMMDDSSNGGSKNSARYVALGDRLNMVDGLGSYIDYQHASSFKDIMGKKLKAERQALFRRLKYQYNLRTKIEKNETDYRIFNILNRVISKLGLSNNVRDRAAYYYKQILKSVNKDEFTNHVILIALCIFISIREHNKNAPITVQELAQIFRELNYRVSAKSIIREALKIKPILGENFNHQIRRSEDYIDRIISEVINSDIVIERLLKNKIDIEEYRIYLTKKTVELLEFIDEKSRGSRNPYIFAVAIVYTASQIRKNIDKKIILTQKILSKITNCAEYSIRDHYKFITNFRAITTSS